MLKKIKKYFEEKSKTKKELDKIISIIRSKNDKIVDNFMNEINSSDKIIIKKLKEIGAIKIDKFIVDFHFYFKEIKNIEFTLSNLNRLQFESYGLDEFRGFKCKLIEPIKKDEYPGRFATGYFLVELDTDEMKRQASFIEKQLGKETIETIRGEQKKVGSKRIFADDKPTKKAKALYKRMIDKDKGYIDIYQFGGGMFK